MAIRITHLLLCFAAAISIAIAIPANAKPGGGGGGGGSATEIVVVLPDHSAGKLTIMGSGLSDSVTAPIVTLGGFNLTVTAFDDVQIEADANLNAFVPGDYLLTVDPNFPKASTAQTLFTLGAVGPAGSPGTNSTLTVAYSEPCPGQTFCSYEANCPAGYVVTGGGWRKDRNQETQLILYDSRPQGSDAWYIYYRNKNVTAAKTIEVYAVCLRQ